MSSVSHSIAMQLLLKIEGRLRKPATFIEDNYKVMSAIMNVSKTNNPKTSLKFIKRITGGAYAVHCHVVIFHMHYF